MLEAREQTCGFPLFCLASTEFLRVQPRNSAWHLLATKHARGPRSLVAIGHGAKLSMRTYSIISFSHITPSRPVHSWSLWVPKRWKAGRKRTADVHHRLERSRDLQMLFKRCKAPHSSSETAMPLVNAVVEAVQLHAESVRRLPGNPRGLTLAGNLHLSYIEASALHVKRGRCVRN